MYVVIVETHIDAEEHAGHPAFLARLDFDRAGFVEQEPGLEVVNHENRRAVAMLAEPGQVFAARRWWWTDDRITGGNVWFTLNTSGAVFPLSEEEAFNLLRNGQGASGSRLISGRTPPPNVFCRLASLSGKPVLRGGL